MEVSLPISATVKPVESRASKVERQAPAKARASTLDPRPSTTSIRLPLAFMLTGLGSLLLGVALAGGATLHARVVSLQPIRHRRHPFVRAGFHLLHRHGGDVSTRPGGARNQTLQRTPGALAIRVSPRRRHRHGLDVLEVGHETSRALRHRADGGRGPVRVQHRPDVAPRAQVERHRHGRHRRAVLDFPDRDRRPFHRDRQMHLRIHHGPGDGRRGQNLGERVAGAGGLHVAFRRHQRHARARASRRRGVLHPAHRWRVLQTHSHVHAQRSAKPTPRRAVGGRC